MRSKLESIALKVILYIILFAVGILDKNIFDWFMNMENMTVVMILMSAVMIVNFGWELVHAK